MKNYKFLVLIISVLFLNAGPAFSQVFSFETEQEQATATFPAGTMFKTFIQNEISTKANKVGDLAYFLMPSDVKVGKSTCIPANSVIIGQVTELEGPVEGRDAYFRILVREINFPDGWSTPLIGRIWTKSGTSIIGGQATNRMEYRKIPHHIEGIGPILELKKTGPRAFGKDRKIKAGTEVVIVLDRDLTVNYLEDLDN